MNVLWIVAACVAYTYAAVAAVEFGVVGVVIVVSNRRHGLSRSDTIGDLWWMARMVVAWPYAVGKAAKMARQEAAREQEQ